MLPAGPIDLQRDYITDSSASALRAVFRCVVPGWRLWGGWRPGTCHAAVPLLCWHASCSAQRCPTRCSPPPTLASSTWSLDDCNYWLQDSHQVGIRLALEEATDKYFPASNSAAEVRDRLVRACQKLGVHFQYSCGVQDLAQLPGGDGWELQLSSGRSEAAQRVVLATGGLSFPSLGTTGDGFSMLSRHCHTLVPPYAALTPLMGGHPGGQQLAGISLYSAELAAAPAAGDGSGSGGGGKKKKGSGARSRSQRSAMLFTHRGYSGPAGALLPEGGWSRVRLGVRRRRRLLAGCVYPWLKVCLDLSDKQTMPSCSPGPVASCSAGSGPRAAAAADPGAVDTG